MSIRLFGCIAVAEVEEGLPAHEARVAHAPRGIDGIDLALPGGIEDHPEERAAVVALEVLTVGRADHVGDR